MARRLVALFLLLGAACASSETSTLERIRQSGVLRVGTDATYPPFESVDPSSGELVGFDVDLIRAVAAQLELKPEFVVVPFDGIIPGLKGGKYDLVISAMTITPQRAAQVRFTEAYTVAGQSVVVRAADRVTATVADLSGRRVGCQLGTTGEMEARRIADAAVVSFDAIGAAFRDLENGHLDAVIADTPTARIFIRDHPSLRLAGEPLTREELGMAVRLQDAGLAEMVDRTLDVLRSTGEMDRLEVRWGIKAAP